MVWWRERNALERKKGREMGSTGKRACGAFNTVVHMQ